MKRMLPGYRIIFLFASLALSVMACRLVIPESPQTPLPATEPPTTPPVTLSTPVEAYPQPADPAYPQPSEAAGDPPAITPNPLAACPQPLPGMTVYTSEPMGFCLRFPAFFTPTLVTENGYDVLWLEGPREPAQPKSMERISVNLRISRTGPALGLDSLGYANRWMELFGGPEAPPAEPFTLGGLPAMVTDYSAGMVTQRLVLVVANENKYTISLWPLPGESPVLDEVVNQVWDEVTATIAFIPPTDTRNFILAGEVCLPPEAGALAYRNDVDGYCLLHPDDFSPDPDFPGAFTGGPILGDYQGFDNVQTSITVGTFGDHPGKTIRDVMAPRNEFSDPASIQDTTVAGYPAITYRHLAGPWASRDTDVLVNGRVYTILGQPWEPVLWPDGIPFLDRAWDMMIRTIRFYDPWR